MSDQEFEAFLKQVSAAAKEAARELPGSQWDWLVEEGSGEAFLFGDYEIVNELGSGGFGVVFLARDRRSGSMVALKLPMPHVLMSRSALGRFLREGRVGATLEHPGIVKVLETGEAGRIYYIASEYVPGPTLAQWLQEQSAPVPARLAVAIVAQMAAAVAHAHERGVIHRDLKPANVILRPLNGTDAGELGFQACLTDFGLAKVLHEIRDELSMTGAAWVGSAAYMAPEQALGQSDRIGPWTDIHALGAILFRVLAGRAPFVGERRDEVLARIANEVPPRLRQFRPDVPKELEWICDQCMRKAPQQRYASAGELLADLEGFLVSERVRARPISGWERALNWSRRHPAVSAVVVASVLFTQVTIVSQARANRRQARTIESLHVMNGELHESQRREAEQKQLAEAREAIAQRAYYDTRLQAAGQLAVAGHVERAQQVLKEIDPGADRNDFAWGRLMTRASEAMEVMAFENHIRLLAMSPDGALAACVGDEGQVSVREVATGREVQRYGVQGNLGFDLRFSRDGRKIYCLMRRIDFDEPGRSRSSAISVREGGVTREILVLAEAMRFVESASGERLRFVDFDQEAGKWRIRKVDIANMGVSGEAGFESAVPPILLEDGRHVVIVDGAGAMRLRTMEGAEGDRVVAKWADVVKESVSVHPGQARVAWVEKRGQGYFLKTFDAGSGHGTSHELSMRASRCSWVEGDERVLIYDEAWNPAVVALRSGVIQRLRAFEVSQKPRLAESGMEVRAIAHGNRLLTYSYFLNPGGYTNQMWDMGSGDELRFPFEGAIGRALTIGESGSVLLMSATVLKRWWPEGRERASRKLAGHTDEAWGGCFAPDGSVLVTTGNDTLDRMTVRVWDWRAGKLVRGFSPHNATVSGVAFSPDGRVMATCALARQDNLILWDTKTGAKVLDLRGHEKSIYAMAFSDDGTRLVSGDKDGELIVWDVAKGEVVVRFRADVDKIRGLSFEPGSNLVVATGSESRRTRIWKVDEKRLVREWMLSGEITALAYVPGRPWLCVAESGGRLVVWNTESGARVRQMDGASGRLGHIGFLPGSGTLATGDFKGNLHLWDIETGVETMNLNGHETPVNRVAFTADGKTMAHDGSVRLWFSR